MFSNASPFEGTGDPVISEDAVNAAFVDLLEVLCLSITTSSLQWSIEKSMVMIRLGNAKIVTVMDGQLGNPTGGEPDFHKIIDIR
ncbi:hypothetical protein N7466_009591 [Penicillium verhagenii]|uniref:uncharacterized protein n=1 Tax=Penicillium verhagenii TaxID=1562060 RepID=UPI0025457D58|nr:uncharacterized protein N7466_009591 [Penicillium verhagenii]KAJ5921265.1 hypothetical protein N7466_009591 [Penicillium verhagenii]